MRLVFFGTPEFAVPTLTQLFADPGIDVVGIVTQPDARRGRGNALSPSPVKAVAIAHQPDLPIWQPERLKKDAAVLAALNAAAADVFVTIAYGQILSQAILDMPKSGCINVHGSLLPKYRGAAPIQRALVAGESVTGITTMLMDAGIDTGAMLLKQELAIAPDDNAETLSAKLARIGADLAVQTLQQLEHLTPIPQDHAAATYSPIVQKEEWAINWTKSAIALHNAIRGFYPNCYTAHRQQRLKILATSLHPDGDRVLDFPTGAIAAVVKNIGFVVQTGAGSLLVREVQPSGKRPQSAWDFVNGTRLQVGEVLTDEASLD